VSWRFTRNIESFPLADYANATFEWSFPGGSPAVSTARNNLKAKYSAKGNYSATVIVNGDTLNSVECAPVTVRGARITCNCFPEGTTSRVNLTDSIVQKTWNASCTSVSPVNGFYWNGSHVSGTSSFTMPLQVGNNAPTLRVTNEDETEINVTCGSVVGFVDTYAENTIGPITLDQSTYSAVMRPNETYVVDATCDPRWAPVRIAPYDPSTGGSSGGGVNGFVESESGLTQEISSYSSYYTIPSAMHVSTDPYVFRGIIYLTSGYARISCGW
jgi:hypothetical protein